MVEGAGCASCGTLVRQALSVLGTVSALSIDDVADVAMVRLEAASALSIDDIERVLEEASAGSGHRYRLQPGSWTPLPVA